MTQEDLIEDLREQVAYWKSEALGSRDAARRGRLQAAYRITRSQAELLEAMYARDGKLLTKAQGDEAVSGHGNERETINTVDVQICRLRKKMPPDSIATMWGLGWHLTPIGMESVRNTLTESQE